MLEYFLAYSVYFMKKITEKISHWASSACLDLISILASSSFTSIPEWSLMPLLSGLPLTLDARVYIILVKVFCKLKRTCYE